MTWPLAYHDDGDALDATALNSAFASAKSWLDATTPEGWRRGCINHHQVASCLRDPGVYFVRSDESGTHIYSETVFTTNLNYNAYGQDDGTSVGSDLGSGFDRALVGHPSATGGYSGPTATLSFSGSNAYRVGMTNEVDLSKNVGAVEVLFNCEIVDITTGDPAETNVQVMFCIQYLLDDGTGIWYTIDESERFFAYDDKFISSADSIWMDAPIRVLITKETIDENGDSSADDLIGIRAMVSKYASSPGAGVVSVELGEFTLTAIPWRCKDAA